MIFKANSFATLWSENGIFYVSQNLPSKFDIMCWFIIHSGSRRIFYCNAILLYVWDVPRFLYKVTILHSFTFDKRKTFYVQIIENNILGTIYENDIIYSYILWSSFKTNFFTRWYWQLFFVFCNMYLKIIPNCECIIVTKYFVAFCMTYFHFQWQVSNKLYDTCQLGGCIENCQ